MLLGGANLAHLVGDRVKYYSKVSDVFKGIVEVFLTFKEIKPNLKNYLVLYQ